MRTRVMLTCLVMALSTFFAILWNQTSSLHIFMWSGYIKPELIKTFEEQFHCRVYTDSFDSNEAMYSKLKFSSSGYDIIVPSSYYIELLARQKIIEPILPQDIPNLVYIDKSFLEKIHAPQSDCGIPFLLSFSGIAYRSDRVREKVDSWTIFSHQKYKGRMTLLNDIRETIGAALVTKGFSPNSLSKNELTEAKNVLLHWKKNIAKFESEQHKNGLASGEFLLVHGYASDCFQVLKEHPEVQFAFPKEGSLVTVDYLAISSRSKQKKLAYDFINFLLEPDNIAANMLYTGGRAPHLKAKEALPEAQRSNPIFYPEELPDTKLESLQPIQNAQKLYSAIWNQVKNESL